MNEQDAGRQSIHLFTTAAQLRDAVESHLGYSEWLQVGQERIDDSFVRAGSTLIDAVNKGEAVQLVVQSTVEVQGADRPALVAETLSRYHL